jgi:2-polyprenyl-6-methoxyphenol hydroxylase-like FAD-dependent oxidoreductase
LIFERDKSISFRGQGYRLRLSTEGLDAIEEVLGPEGFPKFWEKTGKTAGAMGFASLNAITGEVLPQTNPLQTQSKPKEGKKETTIGLTSREGKTIGISRGDMRALFLEGLEDSVRWGHHVTGYDLTDKGVHAIFADGSKSEEGELLVGGEGIYSKVAKQLSKGAIKTFDTGARGIHGQAPTSAFRALGEGVWSFVDDTNPRGKLRVITNVRPGDMEDDSLEFGWTLAAQPGVVSPPNNDYTIVGKVAADIAKDLTKGWTDRIRPLFDQMNVEQAAFWKITCSSPSGVPQWENQPRVTVIGDAAHSMTPAGGIGKYCVFLQEFLSLWLT